MPPIVFPLLFDGPFLLNFLHLSYVAQQHFAWPIVQYVNGTKSVFLNKFFRFTSKALHIYFGCDIKCFLKSYCRNLILHN